jgi:glyoxylase-like metal-dependent hydrolase (beta-lactamase superfamily II)
MYNGLADDTPREAMVRTGAPLDPTDCVSIPTTSFLIDHPEAGYILYDTGWTSRTRLTFPTSPREYIVNTLDRIGVKPEEINYVILSHLHMDHAGNLEPFKNAEIFVSENEFLQVASLFLQNKIQHPYMVSDIAAWSKQDFKWHLIKEQYEVVDFVDGIKFVTLGSGHAFGILALLVQLPKTGNVLITSDAIYNSINVGPPVLPPGIIADVPGWHKSLQYLLEKAAEYHAVIWYGHDLEQFNSLTKADEGYYE